jgi:UDP-N-acetylglucosamine diphosphorylase/glucosamine-1-phosphate N-acetyltransferase
MKTTAPDVWIFEDAKWSNFSPLTDLRPVFHLHCGAFTLAERIRHHSRASSVSFHARRTLESVLNEAENGKSVVNFLRDRNSWFINARLLASEELTKTLKNTPSADTAVLAGDEIAAAYITAEHIGECINVLGDGSLDLSAMRNKPSTQTSDVLAQYPWDLMNANLAYLEKDFSILKKRSGAKAIRGTILPGAHLLNKKLILLGKGSVVYPGAVLDATHGAIVIGENVTVMPNAVVQGPAFIGYNSTVKIAAKIYHGNTIGHDCKIGGEVEQSIIEPYSNKQHDGFLGHSYLGSWVNLGADTNTSDLKNNYGPVSIEREGAKINTRLQFLGSIIGDHSKTGINVMLNTGTIIGTSCNIFGAGLPPKEIPSFSWGGAEGFQEYEIDRALATARTVMKRRGIDMSRAYETMFRSAYALTRKRPATYAV